MSAILLIASVLVDVNVNVDVTDADSSPPPARPSSLLTGDRWEGSISIDAAPEHGFAAAGLAGDDVGIGVSLGRQLGPLRLSVEYGAAKLWATRDLYTADGWWDGWQDVGGELQRWGATARFRAALPTPSMPGDDLGAAVGVYAEVGAGRESIHWNGGGALGRTDVEAGAGVEMALGRHRMGGMDVGVRFLAAPAADGTHDLGILMHFGVLFGI